MTRYLTCVFWLACALAGQNPRLSSVRGELQGSASSDTQVEIASCAGGRADSSRAVAHVDAAGGFEFRGVETGCYQVTVVSSLTGRKLYQGVHDLGRTGEGLQIRLKTADAPRPVVGGVSLGALRPRPPKKAVRLLDQAAALSAAGDFAGAAEQLRHAIGLHPAFAEAHINLGAQLARLGQPAGALAEFEQARLLGVHNAALQTNIAAAHLELKDLAAARAALDQALAQDPAYPQAHFIAGQLALRQGRADQALTSFRLAAAAPAPLPAAHLMLAQVLAHHGNEQEAAGELRAYLASGHQSYRGAAEKLLRQLTQPR